MSALLICGHIAAEWLIKMKRYTLRNIINSMPQNKKRVSSFWVKLIARRLSYVFTYLLINLGCSANFVSAMSGIVVFIGCLLLCIDNTVCLITGVALINLWIVLDCCDGNIARVTNRSSYMGEFFDAISGYVICAFSLIGVGVAAYNRSYLVFGEHQVVNIVIGACGCVSDLFSRLVYQKYTNNYFVTQCKVNGSATYTPENYSFYDPKARKGITYIRLVIDRQLGISGAFMPLLILACIFNLYDVLVLAYSLYHIAALLAVLYLFSKKAIRTEKEMHATYDATRN